MWRIFGFLSRFGNAILFVFLEFIAVLMIVSFNKPHRDISQGFVTEFSGSLGEMQSWIGGYFNLRGENSKLMDQNAALSSKVLRMEDSLRAYKFRRPSDLGFKILPDSIKGDSALLDSVIRVDLPDSILPVSGYQFIPCNAVNNTVHENYNYITLNKGSNHGVKADMGLISPEGIAGQVVGVSRNFSLALSVLNKKFRTSAKILRSGNAGTLTWDGNDPLYAQLEFIPQTLTINGGDSIVTTGYSTVFPPNYFVGVVLDFDKNTNDAFYNIKVKLNTNFYALDNLFLVRHSFRSEIDSLEAQKPEE